MRDLVLTLSASAAADGLHHSTTAGRLLDALVLRALQSGRIWDGIYCLQWQGYGVVCP